MLDHVAIASFAGVLLWCKCLTPSPRQGIVDLVNTLFRNVLLVERAPTDHYDHAGHRLKWFRSEERRIVVVAVYDQAIALTEDFSYIDKMLLAMVKTLERKLESAATTLLQSIDFDAEFAAIEARAGIARPKEPAPARLKAAASTPACSGDTPTASDDDRRDDDGEPGTTTGSSTVDPHHHPGGGGGGGLVSTGSMRALASMISSEDLAGLSPAERAKRKRALLADARSSGAIPGRTGTESNLLVGGRPAARGTGDTGRGSGAGAGGGGSGGLKRPGWQSMGGKLSQAELRALNLAGESADAPPAGDDDVAEFGKSNVAMEVEWPDDDEVAAARGKATPGTDGSGSGWFSGTFFGRALSALSGGHTLTGPDLVPVAEELRQHLIDKNVASSVATEITDHVKDSLVGKRVGAFDAFMPIVRDALRESITRILTPRRVVDVLADARAKADTLAAAAAAAAASSSSSSSTLAGSASVGSSRARPYVIVFTGINGVGKSTSLAKVAYHLKDSGLRPMVAACDTFRAAAIEQLKKHTTRLGIPLYEQGYEKDPSQVARRAIEAAAEHDSNVVLVDTAGRMQNNEGLMRELAKLVSVNDPDLVLFVGEALVGNDGLNQLLEFNRSLLKFAPPSASSRSHGIDGIFLTKCDTIDDKIGSALSMVHATDIPIVFMGVGQQYPDLKRLSIDYVVKTLME